MVRKFVEPYCNWTKMTIAIKTHKESKEHRLAINKASILLEVGAGKQNTVSRMLDEERESRLKRNRVPSHFCDLKNGELDELEKAIRDEFHLDSPRTVRT
jgi:hypothetical protein